MLIRATRVIMYLNFQKNSKIKIFPNPWEKVYFAYDKS